MTEVSRLILFTETEELHRNETTIYVEEIGKFFQWWISSPPEGMKIEVTGEFDNINLPRQMKKQVTRDDHNMSASAGNANEQAFIAFVREMAGEWHCPNCRNHFILPEFQYHHYPPGKDSRIEKLPDAPHAKCPSCGRILKSRYLEKNLIYAEKNLIVEVSK